MLVAKKKDDRFNNVGERIIKVLRIAFGQSKLLREPLAGLLHFFIFWGFMIFLFAVLEAIIQGFYSPFSLRFLGPVYTFITVVTDFFGLLVIASVLIALLRRFVFKVSRLQLDKSAEIDAAVILLLILFVVVSMYLQYSAAIFVNGGTHPGELKPVSSAISNVFFSSTSSAESTYEISWWAHIVLVLSFLNFLPYSKHLHVLTSIPNTYFSNLDGIRNTI